MILRMEDIDGPRSKPEFARAIPEELRWLGLDWDEGPDVGGPFGPYVQSARTEHYLAALKRLEDDGLVYPCYCSRAELAAVASAPHGLASEGPAYPGTCRRLDEAERAERAARKTPSLRFAVPDRPLSFRDGAAGLKHFPAGAGGDFVVRRADGLFGYQLAVVVDDAAMQVTDVLRGEDLLDSTPRQIWLYEALGLPVPRFAHVPLLFGPDGSRLSKRHGAVALSHMRQAGTRPEDIVGYLAYWSGLSDRPEAVKAEDLIPRFSLDRIPREPVLVKEEALRFLCGGRGA